MNHLELFAQLIKAEHDAPKELKLFNQLQTFSNLTNRTISEDQLNAAMSKANQPKMNQLVPALLNLGFTSKQLQELFATSQSNISHHKTNGPAKRPYSNFIFSGILDDVYKLRKGKQIHYYNVRRFNDDYEQQI